MWHEARKQERRIRGLIVDYRKRAERRQDFYERIQADPTQFIQIHGRRCKIHLDPAVAAAGDGAAIIVPWQGQQDNLIDRFDVRAHLDYIPPVAKTAEEETDDLSSEERQCNYERYRILAQNDFLGIPEEKFLHQLYLEEQFGANAQLDAEKNINKKKPQKTGATIGYTYDDNSSSSAPQQTFTNFNQQTGAKTKSVAESDESDESNSDIDMDVSIEVTKLDTVQAHELNSCGRNYGMLSNDFYSYLTKDADEAETLRLAKEEEQEKMLLSGRKSRRERRAQKERRIAARPFSPPSYAAKEEPMTKKKEEEESSRSPSPSDGNMEKITYITSFGAEDELQPHPKISITIGKGIKTLGEACVGARSEYAANQASYAQKVKENLEKLKEISEIDKMRERGRNRSKISSYSRSVSRSRSRSRSRRRSNSRYRLRSRSRSRRRSGRQSISRRQRSDKMYRRSPSRTRRRDRRSRSLSYGKSSRRRRHSSSSSRHKSLSRSRTRSRSYSCPYKRNKKRDSSSSSSSTDQKSRSRSPYARRELVKTKISPKRTIEPVPDIPANTSTTNPDTPSKAMASEPSILANASVANIIPVVVEPPPPPLKRYYGRKRESDESSSSNESGSESTEYRNEQEVSVPAEHAKTSNEDSTLERAISTNAAATASTTGKETGKFDNTQAKYPSYSNASENKGSHCGGGNNSKGPNLRERLKKKMQNLLNKQYKADKKAEIEKSEREKQLQQERDEEMRELALKLRRRQRELRHKYGGQSPGIEKPSDSDDSSSRRSMSSRRSRSRSLSGDKPLRGSRSRDTKKDYGKTHSRAKHRSRSRDKEESSRRRDSRSRSTYRNRRNSRSRSRSGNLRSSSRRPRRSPSRSRYQRDSSYDRNARNRRSRSRYDSRYQKERDRNRDRERQRERDRDRDKDREKDRDRDRGRRRSRERDRNRGGPSSHPTMSSGANRFSDRKNEASTSSSSMIRNSSNSMGSNSAVGNSDGTGVTRNRVVISAPPKLKKLVDY